MTDLAAQITARVRQVVGPSEAPVPLHAPEFNGQEWAMVKDCIDTGWVSSVGTYVDQFEAAVAEAAGTRHGVAVVNGTAALQVALTVAGARPGDEVLVPALTFVATANAVTHAGALPHFVDVAETTLGLDPAALDAHLDAVAEPGADGPINRSTGRRIAAIVPMHTLGHPVDMLPLSAVADAWNLTIVEDAAEALGSCYRGRACGSFGRVAAFSFNGNKIITTGGGGAIVTDDEELARRAKHLTTTAKRPHQWEFDHDAVGWNYRLPNLNAALGYAQFAALPDRLKEKRRLALAYAQAFEDLPGVSFIAEPEGATSNYWLNAIRLQGSAAHQRDTILAALNEAGLMARPLWRPMHELPFHHDAPQASLPVTEALAASVINLPSSACLGRRL